MNEEGQAAIDRWWKVYGPDEKTLEAAQKRSLLADDVQWAIDQATKELKAELVKSRMREIADVVLHDGTVVKFVTPECRAELARLQAEVEYARAEFKRQTDNFSEAFEVKRLNMLLERARNEYEERHFR